MKRTLAAAFAAFTIALSGCASGPGSIGSLFAVQTPKDTQDSIALAYGLLVVSSNMLNNLFQMQALSREEALVFYKRLQTAAMSVEAAEVLLKSDPTKAENEIQAALAILRVLDAELRKRGI